MHIKGQPPSLDGDSAYNKVGILICCSQYVDLKGIK